MECKEREGAHLTSFVGGRHLDSTVLRQVTTIHDPTTSPLPRCVQCPPTRAFSRLHGAKGFRPASALRYTYTYDYGARTNIDVGFRVGIAAFALTARFLRPAGRNTKPIEYLRAAYCVLHSSSYHDIATTGAWCHSTSPLRSMYSFHADVAAARPASRKTLLSYPISGPVENKAAPA